MQNKNITQTPAGRSNFQFALVFVFLYLIILLRTAWITDDAAITLRTVLNFVHGFGPTFNIEERVQAYTHPLWFLVLSLGSLISGNVFYTTFFTSIVISTAALGLLLLKMPHNHFVLVLIALAAVLSKAFVDFSTSGLENPLSHLLLLFAVLSASSYIEQGRDRLIMFFLICSSLYLNRPDLLLIVLPMAAYVATLSIQHPKKIVSTLAIAAAPVIIWTGFSLFYYGFPLPNTAYAKLGAGIAMNERIAQGIKYLLHGVDRDPVTVFVLASGIALGLRGSRLSQSISVGVLLYLMYIVYIGGDFMEGRFLTAPFFMSLIIFAREINTSSLAIGLAAPVLIFGATSMHANVLSGSSYSNTDIPDNGIADERGYYFAKFGMLTARGNTFTPPPWKVSDRSVDVICGELGFTSIRKGPGMHYIDDCGLTDPLLARLPALSTPDWRIGHFFRQLPTGYEESLIQGKNLVLDTKTRAYWQSVRTVTRNSLFDSKRFTEIIRLNFNLVEKPNWQLYQTTIIPRSSSLRLETESRLKTIRTEGADWNAMGNFVFEDTLDIVLDQKTDIRSIDVSVDNNDVYHISGFRNDELVPLATITSRHTTGLARHTIVLKDTVGDVERVRVTAESGDGMYSIGHLIVNDR